jgi:hypothetical protein
MVKDDGLRRSRGTCLQDEFDARGPVPWCGSAEVKDHFRVVFSFPDVQ